MRPILVYNKARFTPFNQPDMPNAVALTSLALGLGLMLMALYWVLRR